MSEETTSPLFEREDGTFVPTDLAQGPWNPEHLHGGPASGLLAFGAESVPTLVPMRIARLTVDLSRAVPMAPLQVVTEVEREGKRLQLVGVALVYDDVVVARARALRVRIGESPEALGHPKRPMVAGPVRPPDPEAPPLAVPGIVGSPGFGRAVAVDRVVGGPGSGAPSFTWYRLRGPVVVGEPVTPFVRLATMADFSSGVANFLETARWSSINPDLTLHVLREPVGDWIGVDAVTHIGGDGIGHSRSSLFDLDGFVGSVGTTQIVDEVAAPYAHLMPGAGGAVVES